MRENKIFGPQTVPLTWERLAFQKKKNMGEVRNMEL